MSRFRTIEVSDPAFEADGLRHLTVKTPNLLGRGDITVFVPRQARTDDRLPVAILLHGVYGSHWLWTHKAGVHLTAQRLIDEGELPPMLIAMPSDGLMFDGTAYLPHNGRRFDAWIVDDVIDAIVAAGLPASSASPRFLGGLSMGGFGALRLGCLHAERFVACAAHSAITDLDQLQRFVEEDLALYDLPVEERAVLEILASNASRLPRLRFDCGVEDELIEPNRKLHNDLEAAGIAHEYAEHRGGHDWAYWSRHCSDSLRFFAACL